MPIDVNLINGRDSNYSYVICGAVLKCSFGSATSKLASPQSHGVFINQKSLMNIMDYKPMINVLPFGLCSSLANPAVASATTAANGNLQKMPCTPMITSPWINGKSDYTVEMSAALTNKSSNVCMYCGLITIENDGQ